MPPAISVVSPSQGPTTGGTPVTLIGSGLIGATAVRFGGTNAASYTVNSATQITAVTPAGSAGSVPVTVVSPTGTSNAVTFTYVAAAVPVVGTVSPSDGPTSGGTSVTITGNGFTGTTAVRFGGTNAASYTVNSATQITAVTPAGAPGATAVTVTTPGGTSALSPHGYFFYAAPPVLTSGDPGLGPASGGTVVTLLGRDLLNAGAVRFGTTNAASFTVDSANKITATAPAGAGTSEITVTTPGGTSNPVPFSYVAAPSLTELVPDHGPTHAATVTLTGLHLSTASAVKFSGVAAGFTVVSDTQATATVPAGAAGPVPVTVTTAGGTSNSLTYTRLAPPGL
ncbi:IPT/TIG domain-containing protein [Streptomyces sp. bgisy153]|uniref:IPT/TIG domain-containing protein n=1 Tax=Streptomyces sp. bgisy153 TaxID=3413793 RepID=UPI003D705B57